MTTYRATASVAFLSFAAALILSATLSTSAQAQRRVSPAGDAPAIPAEELTRRLRRHLDSLAKLDSFSGVVLLARNGTTLFEHAYGLADRERKRANENATAFNVSSIGKLFTQIAIGQLVAQHKLNLDATIASVWPDFPNPDVARQVTIRQLLAHRSGIGGDIFQNPGTLHSNGDYLASFVHDTLNFAPGSHEEYSNAGYIVLGEIIARVFGRDYYDYVRSNVIARARMVHTGYYPLDSLPRFAAFGYTHSERGQLQRNTDIQPRIGSAAGGVYSTVEDLLRFLIARRDGSLGVDAEPMRALVAGGSPGSNAMVAEDMPGGYDMIVVSNFDPPAATSLVDSTLAWLGAPAAGVPRRRLGVPTLRAGGVPAGLPGTPAGSIAAAYLRAYNSGDTAEVLRFFRDLAVDNPSRPIAMRVAAYRKLYEERGALTLESIVSSVPTALGAIVRDSHGDPMTLTFHVEATRPYRLASLEVRIEASP